MFASQYRYKRESYRGSTFAPRVLADNGIPVVMKTDHPVVNDRYLIHEAQQAHYYGLPAGLALTSVTSTSARAAGLEHRIGPLHEGVDADVVLWDSHPLQLEAAPRQVWIDGIPQLTPTSPTSILVGEPKTGRNSQSIPHVPIWDAERKDAVKWEGLPPLGPKKVEKRTIVLRNVSEVWMRDRSSIRKRWSAGHDQRLGTVVLQNGTISCVEEESLCLTRDELQDANVIDIHGGTVGPGLMTFGSPLGIDEISYEASTKDGRLYEAFASDAPKILGDTAGIVRAVDALQFGTRDALLAHRGGVTYATASLSKTSLFTGVDNIISGLSTTIRTGAAHALDAGATIKEITALHISISRYPPFRTLQPPVSVSTIIAALRRLLLTSGGDGTETGIWFNKAAQGSIPLVVQVQNADIMATLLRLKGEVEAGKRSHMKLVFVEATDSHLIAKEIADANVGVILTVPRPFPGVWDSRRILVGPPLTNHTTITKLVQHSVTVALGSQEAWQSANIRFDAGWAALESSGRISKKLTYKLVTTNLEKLLGMEGLIGEEGDLVVYDGGNPFGFGGKVVAIASLSKGTTELL